MEYHSGLTKKGVLTLDTAWMNTEDTLNKLIPKGQMLPDTTYIRYLDYSDSQRQQVAGGLPEAVGGGNGELLFNGNRILKP